jgi:shikimate dehydrogenase
MRKFGLLGRSLGHSYSQRYFREKFDKLQLSDCDYLLFELAEVSLFPELVSNNPELVGLNVTIPYKKEILAYLDGLSTEAQEIGAVNTIQILKDGRNIGHNTDVMGFEKCLRPVLQGHMERALILGNGGAAAAVAYVLRKIGISYHFVSRSEGESCISYNQISASVIANHFLIINTTPVGQYPETTLAPVIPYDAIGPLHTCLDLIYNPAETEFIRRCRQKGAWTDNGLSMLYAQAEASWEIWNS